MNNSSVNFLLFAGERPQAMAVLRGSEEYPGIRGTAAFYRARMGTIAAVQVSGLPQSDDICKSPVFAMHIHSGNSCTGNAEDGFADAMTHYNPKNCPHPYHAGDMPPLFGANGYAFTAFLTDRFDIKEIIGRTVIIHAHPDDFTSQPSGNSGAKIACGVIAEARQSDIG